MGASPVSFFNKPFKGTDVYKPEDIPEIDYLIISHDHWDHLDYNTVMALKDRIGKVICGLGVGAHFEYWGFDKEDIIELDWNESASLNNGFKVYCLPARHFSGRGLSPNQSLWASYLIETPTQKIYIGGDSGYDTHYAEIGKQFGNIDLAILENGQYDKDWRYIHLLPENIIRAFKDLNAKKLFTVHHSKYALGNHPWDEPLKNISSFAERDSINLILPMMGEKVNLNDSIHAINKWWEGIE
jgi:L-ascorbate metabolism protein UlaG (beta-lactamase superfamily)